MGISKAQDHHSTKHHDSRAEVATTLRRQTQQINESRDRGQFYGMLRGHCTTCVSVAMMLLNL